MIIITLFFFLFWRLPLINNHIVKLDHSTHFKKSVEKWPRRDPPLVWKIPHFFFFLTLNPSLMKVWQRFFIFLYFDLVEKSKTRTSKTEKDNLNFPKNHHLCHFYRLIFLYLIFSACVQFWYDKRALLSPIVALFSVLGYLLSSSPLN